MIPLGQFFATYGFRTTFFAVLLVGFFAGGAGSFLYMRAQSLMSDVMGHSAILGVVGAFSIAASLGANGQSTLVVSVGAATSAFVAVALANWVVANTPTKPDAAMAVALSLFYGGGLCAIHILNHSKIPGKAGMMSYLFGNAATVRAVDLYTVATLGALASLVVIALWKEIALLVFDPVLSRVGGFRPRAVDTALTCVVTIAIVLGVKSVGIILVVAFALMPAAVVRPFVSSMLTMVLASSAMGALAGAVGAYLSISLGNVPTGPIVVLVLFAAFIVSLLIRAVVPWRHRRSRVLDAPRVEGCA